jgi:hypothetical protein
MYSTEKAFHLASPQRHEGYPYAHRQRQYCSTDFRPLFHFFLGTVINRAEEHEFQPRSALFSSLFISGRCHLSALMILTHRTLHAPVQPSARQTVRCMSTQATRCSGRACCRRRPQSCCTISHVTRHTSHVTRHLKSMTSSPLRLSIS